MNADSSTGRRWGWMAPALILLAAIAVRGALTARGGQYYTGDEVIHCQPAFDVAWAVARHNWNDAVDGLLKQQHHMAFRIPSAVAAIIAWQFGPSRLSIVAFVLSFSSVAVLLLVHALARRTGAGPGEAAVAMLFAATATSLTYFARHLMPYDTGMAIDLFALWLALRPGGFGRAVTVGAVACFGFLTYYAYLALALLACGVHVLRSRAGVVHRLLGVAIGAVAVFACFEIASVTRGATIPWMLPAHVALWRLLHGAPESWGSSYAEGWWVPWAYLWHVEHLVLVVWMVFVVLGCIGGAARARWYGAAALGLYVWMTLHSTVLGESVVLGRFVRQVVPLLCLAAAAGLADVLTRLQPHGRTLRYVTTAAVPIFAAVVTLNLRPVFMQRFPMELGQQWRTRHPHLAYGQTLVGPDGTAGTGRYVAYNIRSATPPWPVLGVVEEPFPGCVLEAYPHPLAWPAYQYEGYSEAARAAVRARPYVMALVDREATAPCPPPAGE